MKLTFIGIGFILGFLLGQQYMIKAYDPKVLENNTLKFTVNAYYQGCFVAAGVKFDDECRVMAQLYYNDVKDIWHNKVWDKHD